MSSDELYSDEDMPTMSPIIQSHNPPKDGEEEEKEKPFILEQYQQVEQQIHHQLKTHKKLQEYEREKSAEPPNGMPNPMYLSSPAIHIAGDDNTTTVKSPSKQQLKPSQPLEPVETSKYRSQYDSKLLDQSMMGEDSIENIVSQKPPPQQNVEKPLQFPSPEKSSRRSEKKEPNMSYYMEDTYKKHEAKEYIPLPFNNVQPVKLSEEEEKEKENNKIIEYVPPTVLYKSTTEIPTAVLPPPPLNTSTKLPHFVKGDNEEHRKIDDEDEGEEGDDENEDEQQVEQQQDESYNEEEEDGRKSPMFNIPSRSILNIPVERVASAEEPKPLEFQTIETNNKKQKWFVTLDIKKKQKVKNNKISPIPKQKQSKVKDSELTKEQLEKKKQDKIEKRKQRKSEKEKKRQEKEEEQQLQQQHNIEQGGEEGDKEYQQMMQRISPFVMPSEELKDKSKPASAGFHNIMERTSPFTQMNSVINLPPSPLRTETPDEPILYSKLPPKVVLSEHFSNLKVLFQKKFSNSNEVNLMLFRIFLFNYQHKYKCLPDTLEYILYIYYCIYREFLIDNNLQLTPSQLYFITEYSLSKRKFNPELLIRLLPEGVEDQFIDIFNSLFKYIRKDEASFKYILL